MANNFNALLDLANFIEKQIGDIERQVAINLITTLAAKTPKKTGAATGEWQVTINKKATRLTGREDLNGSETALIGTRIIEKTKDGKYPDIWVSNLIDYIVDLNNGTSDQAPAKFIEQAEREALASVR